MMSKTTSALPVWYLRTSVSTVQFWHCDDHAFDSESPSTGRGVLTSKRPSISHSLEEAAVTHPPLRCTDIAEEAG